MTTATRGGFGLPLERIIEPGFSGGAVLAANGDIVGIHKTSSYNIAGVIPAPTVREFLAGAIGVRCERRRLVPCLDKATAHAPALAKAGNADARYQLGRVERYIPGERQLDFLEQAARQGNPNAQSDLSGVYDEGAPVIPRT